MSEIYLDYAASTPLLPQVQQKLLSVLPLYANPSSLHIQGQQAATVIEEARQEISKKLHCLPQELYFTSGATMSNNQAIRGFLKSHSFADFVTSSIEHDDIYLMIQDYPYDLKHIVPCDRYGRIDINYLKNLLDDLQSQNRVVLLSIQWANNEMGVVQNMKVVSDLVSNYHSVYLHTDATQYVPYYPIDLQELGIDMLSCSAQKIGGLKGTGLLYVREGISLSPIIYGDQGLIGGTENVPGIACIGEAFKYLDYSYNQDLLNKIHRLFNELKDYGELVGSFDNRLPNNLNMIFEGIKGEELQALLSEFGIYVSTGSACSSHIDKPSRTLTALKYTPEQANSSIRFSIGKDITDEEIIYVSNITKNSIEILRNK